jgi:hypothetical protein
MYATLGSEQTLLLRKGVPGGDNPRDDPVFSVIQGERLAYASITWPRSTVTVYDRRTKLHSSYFEYDQPSLDVFQLLLSDDYVFWLYPGGTGRAHLATGKVDQFADRLSCWRSAGSWFRFPSIPPSAPSTRVVAACELVRKRTPEVILSRAVHRTTGRGGHLLLGGSISPLAARHEDNEPEREPNVRSPRNTVALGRCHTRAPRDSRCCRIHHKVSSGHHTRAKSNSGLTRSSPRCRARRTRTHKRPPPRRTT